MGVQTPGTHINTCNLRAGAAEVRSLWAKLARTGSSEYRKRAWLREVKHCGGRRLAMYSLYTRAPTYVNTRTPPHPYMRASMGKEWSGGRERRNEYLSRSSALKSG